MAGRERSAASERTASPDSGALQAEPAPGETSVSDPIRFPGRGPAPAPDRLAYVAAAGMVLAIAAGLAELLAGPGTRLGWWPFPTGFAILHWGAYGGIAGAAVSFVAGVAARPGAGRTGTRIAVAGLLVGLTAAAVPWSFLRIARSVPAIHDISTDTENPPAFVALLPARREAPNGAGYGGPEVAAKQRAAYPDVRPLRLSVPPAEAFDRALDAAQKMGWKIAAADKADGRIEATATTFWFGFRDDVVVRVAPDAAGSRIDVRSDSRVGLSDLGTNARRIQTYLKVIAGAA